ncbi:Eco57I restriction-modification methylase domain-containing protein [Flavobacterium crassostreae]|uniref:site-specific DNA-methyltransferase (adenine-specific) n=1 Tax=Flavobacterium crassostreae TaxID=1763534 RepID=A0A1B9E5K5_9FLAO|nr:N-6 DNA methylase [Flavobacterium crassostreae]OCB77244.1 restriction endonuclease subunit M [Flavobacterium crassostreae]
MALYQKSVLNKHLKQLDSSKVTKAYQKYTRYFLNPTIQDNIRNSKEEEYQGIFLTELFVNILEYTLKPNIAFNLVAEYKNQTNSRKADGAILNNTVAIGVIELKGTKTKDLESIRQQAFDYKANQKDCVYVITSNYEKLRFYINDATEFEEFNLFELTPERFELLYLCLQKDNILNNIPLQIKEASIVVEEQITKQFYKDYSVFKRELFRDLVKRNAKRLKSSVDSIDPDLDEEAKAEQLQLDKNFKLTLFKKSQKLIDRFLFVFFAEDRGLLPPNSTIQILNKWKADVDFGDERPLYDLFKQYFRFLDTGRQGTTNRAEIYAYNGGLFKEDSLLDKLEIDNDLLYKHTQTLASYDFESQVDVNILGHIFENSLNEIESVNAEIEGGDFDKQKSKRKKDGVFYTPKYITKYIVENTIGKLCEEKKNELGFKEEEYFKGRKNRQQATIIKLVEILDTYRDWLLQLTICDPACGSGAFLNQALDFLIKEHNYIDELKAKILGGGLVFSDIENTILENNIYGVDLNEESVEIAKLSLWLRTAQPRRKLNSLNNNIKCGNSLIDSKAVAGDKAFNWQEQFPSVFAKGGFDVIIGNPPYVRVQSLKEFYFEQTLYLEKKYVSATGKYDLYALFMEKSYYLINEKGIVSYILPHKFLVADFGVGIRKFFIDTKSVDSIVHFGSKIVFNDAATYTCIINLKKNNNIMNFINIDPSEILESFNFEEIKYKNLSEKPWILKNNLGISIMDKINAGAKLKEICEGIYQGLITTGDDIFMLEGVVKNDLFYGYSKELGQDVVLESTILKEVLKGQDIKRYLPLNSSKYVIYPHKLNSKNKTVPFEPEEFTNQFPLTEKYLSNFKQNLIDKKTRYKTNPKYWYSLHRSREIELFEKDYIITPQLQNIPSFTNKETDVYADAGGYLVLLKPEYKAADYLPILNSKILWYFIKNTSSEYGGGYFYFKTKYLEPFGIPLENVDKYNFSDIAKKQLSSTKCFFQVIGKFTKYLQSQFAIQKLTKKLENWYELDFGDFIKEINKAIKVTNKERVKNELQPIKELTKLDEMDWMDVFETKKAEAQALKQQINSTDREIDAMVYELYGLSEEEIAIVENS